MITYQSEPFSTFYADAKKLIAAHWDEVATFSDVRKLMVDEDGFLKADALGLLICTTARDAGDLIGYVVGYITAPQHTKDTKRAGVNYYFIDTQHRGSGVFSALCVAFEDEARSRGAVDCSNRQKLKNGVPANAPDRFFEAMGYDKESVVWVKRL